VTAPEAVRRAFELNEPILKDVAQYVKKTLEPYSRKHGYIFLDRIKSLPSLAEKLEGGRVSKWSHLDDLYACTIVVPVAAHEEGVLRKLDASFERVKLRTRTDIRKAPEVFRFDGARWYGRVRAELAAERRVGMADQIFEVQIATAFEYAWIAVTHDLVYKGNHSDWQRHRLAAQLKAAVEQIELIIAAFDPASDAIVQSPWPDTTARAEVISRCQLLAADGYIPETLIPDSWRRFADNVCALVRSYERDRSKTEQAIEELFDFIDADLRGQDAFELPVSGSLFQYIESVVDRPGAPGKPDGFVIVPSPELSDLYGIGELAKSFEFDGLPAPASDITDG
jgi:ppGpp synthetase/RelA/SpoT-type nucleotidyltranferase